MTSVYNKLLMFEWVFARQECSFVSIFVRYEYVGGAEWYGADGGTVNEAARSGWT